MPTAPAWRYCAGLLLPGDRQSIEPVAARVEPGRDQATRQSLQHLVAKADWSDAAVLAVVQSRVSPAIEQHGPIQAYRFGLGAFEGEQDRFRSAA